MPAAIAEVEHQDTGSISLYFDLEPGSKADLETVARTAIAFAAVIRRVTAHIDFTAEVRIELESGTEGSLGLNAVVRWVKGFGDRHPKLTGIVAGAMLIILVDTRAWTVGKILDFLTGPDAPPIARTLTPDEAKRVAEQLAEYLKQPIAEEERRQIYDEAQRDQAIRGLGTSGVQGKRPETIVPRSDFPRLSMPEEVAGEDLESRTVVEDVTLTLIRPRLKAEPASWRFQYGTMPEFSAVMRDREFLNAMADGRLPIHLQIGIEMQVLLETEEALEGGVWVAKKRSVTRVLRPLPTPAASLFDGHQGDDSAQ